MRQLSQTILRLLLGKGYFPSELPSVFTTVDFGKHATEILRDWEHSGLFKIKQSKDFPKYKGAILAGRYGYKNINHTDPEIISKPKRLYERRSLCITHPVPQALLTKEIADNWRELQRILARSKYSDDRIDIAETYERSVKGINFQLHRAKKGYIEATADWLVRTDISRFYPSIYTHSIVWAAYGKERVKRDLRRYDGSFAFRLDELVRACNRNQSVGIPIGPETSRIIAEVISSRIDCEYAAAMAHPKAETVDRLQDDWLVGAASLEEAERILSIINLCYREYGLEINGSKTSITHILGCNEESWKAELSAFLSHRKGNLLGARLEEFMNLSLRLQLASPGEPVIKYSLAVLEGRNYSSADIIALESFLLKAAAISPQSMDVICRIILNVEHDIGGLSRDRIAQRFAKLAERHFENGALFEAIWLIYTIRGLKKTRNFSKIIDIAENVPSSVIRLIFLEMREKGICLNKLPVRTWETDLSEEGVLSGWTWLYGYEAIRRGWLADTTGLLSKPFFKAMDKRGVAFYDPSKNVKSSFAVKKSKNSIRKQQGIAVTHFLNALRGESKDAFSPSEY